jgi:hypothetical protein
MNMTLPSSVTPEEAVALMINFDYIPTGYSLLEILSYLVEAAEVEYENALIDKLPEDEIQALKFKLESSTARHKLAEHLFKQIDIDLKANDYLVKSEEFLIGTRRLTLDSVIEWASEKHDMRLNLQRPQVTKPVLLKENTSKNETSFVKLNNVYVVFASLLETYLEEIGSEQFKIKKSGEWNQSAIAGHLQRIKDPNNPIYNNNTLKLDEEHSDLLHEKEKREHQTLRKLISAAFEAKKKTDD